MVKLADTAHRRLQAIGVKHVSRETISSVLQILYSASLRTEEGRFPHCCLTYADPANPDPESPAVLRGFYPRFTPFSAHTDCTAERITKLSRAIDSWAGSIAIFGTARSGLSIWGFVDQRVNFNLGLNLEPGGFGQPGLFTAVTEGPGQISVYHNRFFLGGLRHEEIYTNQPAALDTRLIIEKKMLPYCKQLIGDTWRHSPLGTKRTDIKNFFVNSWKQAIQRICIGIQRAGTGGAIIITPRPDTHKLTGGYACDYDRLGEAIALQVLHYTYQTHLLGDSTEDDLTKYVQTTDDVDDRTDELTGVVRLLSSIATIDGVSVLSPTLRLERFGAKINSSTSLGLVYDWTAPKSGSGPANFAQFDYTKYGMRHLSVLRYCKNDREAIGVIVSQDGTVRLVATHGKFLGVFDNIKLRDYETNAQSFRAFTKSVISVKRMKGQKRGMSDLPQSLSELSAIPNSTRTVNDMQGAVRRSKP